MKRNNNLTAEQSHNFIDDDTTITINGIALTERDSDDQAIKDFRDLLTKRFEIELKSDNFCGVRVKAAAGLKPATKTVSKNGITFKTAEEGIEDDGSFIAHVKMTAKSKPITIIADDGTEQVYPNNIERRGSFWCTFPTAFDAVAPIHAAIFNFYAVRGTLTHNSCNNTMNLQIDIASRGARRMFDTTALKNAFNATEYALWRPDTQDLLNEAQAEVEDLVAMLQAFAVQGPFISRDEAQSKDFRDSGARDGINQFVHDKMRDIANKFSDASGKLLDDSGFIMPADRMYVSGKAVEYLVSGCVVRRAEGRIASALTENGCNGTRLVLTSKSASAITAMVYTVLAEKLGAAKFEHSRDQSDLNLLEPAKRDFHSKALLRAKKVAAKKPTKEQIESQKAAATKAIESLPTAAQA